MKLAVWSLIMMAAVSSSSVAQSLKPVRVYVGTYTQPEKSQGIYLFELGHDWKLEPKGLAGEVGNPSFLAIHPSGRYVYAVSETGSFQGKKQGAVSAFRIETDGKLTMINQQGSGGSGPCHISIDPTGKAALVAHYGSAHITSLPIAMDGSLKEVVSSFQHQGSSVNPGRQKEAHAHSTWLFPAQPTLALACDLGMDKIMLYDLDPETAKLTEHSPKSVDVPPGSGPRHMAFNGNDFYVINEMLCTIDQYRFDGQTFKHVNETVSTLPAGTKVEKGYSTAEIVVHPNGKFVYGSNRGHDTIAIFAIGENGKLSLIGNEPTRGKEPRNFNITPDGRWLAAANQKSDDVVVFKIDEATGKLTVVGEPVKCFAPVCVKFLAP
jgi:6-phosphogluconolactonase